MDAKTFAAWYGRQMQRVSFQFASALSLAGLGVRYLLHNDVMADQISAAVNAGYVIWLMEMWTERKVGAAMTTIREYEKEITRSFGAMDDRGLALGLVGEAGEVADLIKKLHYHGGGDKKGPIMPDRILNESGDVLWYLTALLRCYGFTLEDCMAANIAKLQKRYPNGFTFKDAQMHQDELPAR